jgi:hypothetical protein
MDKLKLWFKSKNITTHTVWIGLVTFAVLFDSSPDFRNQIGQLFAGHPVIITKIGIICSNIVILTTIWAKISQPNKPTQNSEDKG